MSDKQREIVLTSLPGRDLEFYCHDFQGFAHPHQRPPLFANNGEPWTTWLLIGGRGAGKTRAGAEWVRSLADAPKREGEGSRRIALVGESELEIRDVMVEGVSGLLAVHPQGRRPQWHASLRKLEWENGTIAQTFSAEDPESLRGPQFHAAWLDELAKWRHAEATFDMLQFGLRLGERPRQVITTTPRPIPLLKKLIADPRSVVTRAATHDNAEFLAPAFVDTILQRYAGTRLGRQEIDGEIVDDRPDALWSRSLIEQSRVATAPDLQRIVVAVDPPASASKGADACGLVAAGRAENGNIYVTADESAAGLSPAMWAAKAIALWRRVQADALVVEVNQGGDMVRAVIGEQDRSVPVIAVHARRGKWLRAEPVAALYEQGKVKHAGAFPALEDEIWAVTHLSFGAGQGPRIRVL